MDVMEKLVELMNGIIDGGFKSHSYSYESGEQLINDEIESHLISHVVTVRDWINSEEMLPEFPCLAIDVNGNSVFIPDGILTIKDKHGEWCINASLAKEVRLIDGTKMDALIWENRIAYWMPLPKLPKPPKGE